MNMIKENRTWKLVEKPTNQKVIGLKWVCRTKFNIDGFGKARLVVKDYDQQHRVDFSHTLALMARHDTIRLLVALTTNGLENLFFSNGINFLNLFAWKGNLCWITTTRNQKYGPKNRSLTDLETKHRPPLFFWLLMYSERIND